MARLLRLFLPFGQAELDTHLALQVRVLVLQRDWLRHLSLLLFALSELIIFNELRLKFGLLKRSKNFNFYFFGRPQNESGSIGLYNSVKIFFLLIYYWRLLTRNPKPFFYFCTSLIVHLVLLGGLIFLQTKAPSFYFHRILIFSYLFQFFYNHLYYGLGWESSFRYFVFFQLKLRNTIYLYLFVNMLGFIYSYTLFKVLGLIGLLSIEYDFINIFAIYFLVPNLLFVFVFPALTIYIDLFNTKAGLVIHKYYAFPLLLLAIGIPALLQHLWSNYSYGPGIVLIFSILLTVTVVSRFSKIVSYWERRLLQTKVE